MGYRRSKRRGVSRFIQGILRPIRIAHAQPDPDPEPPPPPPDASYVHYDTFGGTDGTSLDARTVEFQPATGLAWDVLVGAATVQGNNAQGDHTSGSQAIVAVNTGRTDEAMRLEFTWAATGSNRQVGLVMRLTDSDTFLQALCHFDSGYFRIISADGAWTNLKIANVTYDVAKTYVIRFGASGDIVYARLFELVDDVEIAVVAGNDTLAVSTSIGNANTTHGFRLANTVGQAGNIVNSWASYDPTSVPALADVTATVSDTSYATSTTHMSMTIVDNNLRFAGAETQKAAALAAMNGNFHHLNLFQESFGNDDTMGSWDGVSDVVGDMPTPDTSDFESHWSLLDTGINPDTWGVFVHRLPWQFTGSTDSSQVTTKSTSADYNDEARRLLTNKSDQFVEWVAQIFEVLFAAPYNIKAVYLGSEGKGFQTVVPVTVDGVVVRAARSNSWDWDDYAGTAGRADMGQMNYLKLLRAGLQEAATRASVAYSTIRIVSPYPVIAHRGSRAAGASIVNDTLDDWLGDPVDFSDINGDNATKGGWGWANKGAAVLTAEHVRLMSELGVTGDEWEFGSDFGTFNTDNIPTPGITDHDLAYKRAKGHFAFYRKLLEQYGYTYSVVKKRLPEYYAKAQEMATIDNLPEALRYKYQASVRAVFLFACYEDLIDYPDMWSPYGRGDQTTDSGLQTDERQWYGGIVKRTVTDNNDHAGTAVTDGGTAQAAMDVVEGLHDNFPPGTALHSISFSSSALRGIASDTQVAVQNQTGSTLTLSIEGGAVVTLDPYEFAVVAY